MIGSQDRAPRQAVICLPAALASTGTADPGRTARWLDMIGMARMYRARGSCVVLMAHFQGLFGGIIMDRLVSGINLVAWVIPARL